MSLPWSRTCDRAVGLVLPLEGAVLTVGTHQDRADPPVLFELASQTLF